MADSVWFRIKVPPEILEEVSKAAYITRYKNDKRTAPIYKALLEMPTVPLKQIAWILEKELKIQRKPEALKNIALKCGLPFTE